MRTAIKVVAGGLVGFLGNLIPNALPDRTVTVPDLIWATVTGLTVCLAVLGVTHARVWPRWAFTVQAPITRESARKRDEGRSASAGAERRVIVTGPPIIVPV